MFKENSCVIHKSTEVGCMSKAGASDVGITQEQPVKACQPLQLQAEHRIEGINNTMNTDY